MENGVGPNPFRAYRNSFEGSIAAEAYDVFKEAQRAAKLKDWKAFNRLMDDHRNLCAQWKALIS